MATGVSILVNSFGRIAQYNQSQHLIVDFVRILEAFVFNAGKITANAYYSDLAAPLEYAKTILYVTQTVLADCVLVGFSA
jgi:hypothetical protein